MVAHVISYDDLPVRGLVTLVACGRFRVSRINSAALARFGGTAEALLMAMAGRRGVVSELSGPGQRTLARRAGGR